MQSSLLLAISIRGYTPQTYGSNDVAKKIKLRDSIKSKIDDLSIIQRNCEGKKLSVDVCFNLFSATSELGRKTKDLDNLLKILLDTLPDYMDRAKTNEGLGLVPEDRDDLVFQINCRKKLVSNELEEGIDLKISEYIEN